jgi:hypothetical protein
MADELDHYRQLLVDDCREAHFLATEARSALAQPEPQGPTDEELGELWDKLWAKIDEGEVIWAWQLYARAVLARWGCPAIEPVPVAERLPGAEDCGPEGRCWAWNPESLWWDWWQPKFIIMCAGDPYTHWLPHHALPVPNSNSTTPGDQ